MVSVTLGADVEGGAWAKVGLKGSPASSLICGPAKLWVDIEGSTGFEDVDGWNKKWDEAKLERVVFGEKFEGGGNNLGERLVEKEVSGEELENLVRSEEKAASCSVLSSSAASCGASCRIVFVKKFFSILLLLSFSSHTTGFFAEQLTSCRRTPSWKKVPSCSWWWWQREQKMSFSTICM